MPLAVRMGLQAPDACQGAVWPLEFTGTAISEDGPPVSSSSGSDVSGSARAPDGMAVTGTNVVRLLATAVALLAAGWAARRRGPALAGGSARQRRPR